MLDTFDVLLVDLQDLGCRIYTFITTLRYVLEAAAAHGKAVWVLDRPNPAGRPVEGLRLRSGLGELRRRRPPADAPRPDHGRAGALVRAHAAARRGLPGDRDAGLAARRRRPGYGWPLGERSWVNPSPNAPNLSMARCYAGTVMLEGTTLSEGRGTTRPLELFGAPDLDAARAARRDARARAALAARLPPAAVLVRADLPQARRASCAPACRSTSTTRGLRPRRVPALAPAGARVQGAAPAAARLPAVARLPLRIRARPAGHRPDQRRRVLRHWVDDPGGDARPTWTRWPAPTRRPGLEEREAVLCIGECDRKTGPQDAEGREEGDDRIDHEGHEGSRRNPRFTIDDRSAR